MHESGLFVPLEYHRTSYDIALLSFHSFYNYKSLRAFGLHLHTLVSAYCRCNDLVSIIIPWRCILVLSSHCRLESFQCVNRFEITVVGLSSGTRIFYPSDPDWLMETTQRYTVHDAPTYVASIKPALESDVQKIV